MTRTGVMVGVAAATIAVAVVAVGGPVLPSTVPDDQVNALSGIDLPLSGERGKELIESSFCPQVGCVPGQPVQDLITVARDPEADPGVRLRAYRALGLYAEPAVNTALTADLAALADAQPGIEQLYLRAVIQSLGEIGEPPDVAKLVPFLDYEASRDIRAATADALRRLGCSCEAATEPLLDRYFIETTEQVKLAIQRALRELGDP